MVVDNSDVLRHVLILILFLWALVNFFYYLLFDGDNKYYALAFIFTLMYQIVFYSLVLAEQFGYFIKPYDDYFVDLSYKRNMLYALMMVVVSVDVVIKQRRLNKLVYG